MSVAAEAPAPSRVLESWSFLWAATVLFAQTAVTGWYYLVDGPPSVRTVLDVTVVAVALALLVRPSGMRGLTILCAAQLAQAAYVLPELPNNGWIMALLNVAFLSIVAPRSRDESAIASAFRRFQAAGRAVVVVCYGFAFFAKLNGDFLDPATSCAAQFYGNVGLWLPLPQAPWARMLASWATLLIEGLLTVALAVTRGRWRTATVLVGMAFHFALALDLIKAFVNFSAVMTAGLLLFLPSSTIALLAPERSGWRSLRTCLASGFVALVAFGFLASRGAPFAVAFLACRQLLFAAVVAAVAARIVTNRAPADTAPAAKRSPAVALVVALAVLNGLSPYLGIKTRTAFDMYSNLRLEADDSNHFLVPRSLDLFGFLRDRVIVEEVGDPEVGEVLEPGSQWPWFEFARRAAESKGRIVFIHEGIREVHDPPDHSRIEAPSWPLRKLLVFRPFGESTRALCLW